MQQEKLPEKHVAFWLQVVTLLVVTSLVILSRILY